jgi:hypothetical protein
MNTTTDRPSTGTSTGPSTGPAPAGDRRDAAPSTGRPAPHSSTADDAREDDEPTPAFDLFTARPEDPPNIRFLRRLVIGLGVVMVAMLIVVIGRIVYLATRPPAGATVTVGQPIGATAGASAVGGSALGTGAAGAIPEAARPLTADIALSLPAGAKVRAHSLFGTRLAVHYEAPAGEGIVVLDLETGRAASHVRLRGP